MIKTRNDKCFVYYSLHSHSFLIATPFYISTHFTHSRSSLSGDKSFGRCVCERAESISTTMTPSEGMLPIFMVSSWSGRTWNIRSTLPLVEAGVGAGGVAGCSYNERGRRKEGRSKQEASNAIQTTKQSNTTQHTQGSHLFKRKKIVASGTCNLFSTHCREISS